MKAETESGEIITLPKECHCSTHDEPHWLHMDRLDRDRNRKLLEQQTFLGCMGMATEEVARLREKERNFRRLGIVRLIPEMTNG